MSNGSVQAAGGLGDELALAVQELRRLGKLDNAQPLLRIEPTEEAASAPFQFDSAEAVLHRTGCHAIPPGSRSALYAVWKITQTDLRWACRKCRPMPKDNQPERPADVADVLFGVLSLVDQFGSVLSQRGRDFRQSPRGRQMERSMSELLASLGQTQKTGMKLVVSTMDQLLDALDRYNRQAGRNGNRNGNGRPPSSSGARKSAGSKRRNGPPQPKPHA